MNTANNRRRQETVRTIEKAFIGLIQDKELDQICISQLCREAGINRTTKSFIGMR